MTAPMMTYSFNRRVSTSCVRKALKKCGFRPATPDEQLAFLVKKGSLPEGVLIALGDAQSRDVGIIGRGNSKRSFAGNFSNAKWAPGCNFLAVRIPTTE